MATTTIGQTTDQRQNPSKILYWAVGLAVLIILGLAFSMMRQRNVTVPQRDLLSTPMNSVPQNQPEPNPTRDNYRYTDPT